MKRLLCSIALCSVILMFFASSSYAAREVKSPAAAKKPVVTSVKTPATNPQTGQTGDNGKQTATDQPVLPSTNSSDNLQVNPPVFKDPMAGEKIDWDVLSSGGGPMTSANFQLDGTLGQTAIGEMTSASYVMNAGFWQDFGTTGQIICGDVDASGEIDIADVVYAIRYIFGDAPAPDPPSRMDVDCSNFLDIGDVVYLIRYMFEIDGPVPCADCK